MSGAHAGLDSHGNVERPTERHFGACPEVGACLARVEQGHAQPRAIDREDRRVAEHKLVSRVGVLGQNAVHPFDVDPPAGRRRSTQRGCVDVQADDEAVVAAHEIAEAFLAGRAIGGDIRKHLAPDRLAGGVERVVIAADAIDRRAEIRQRGQPSDSVRWKRSAKLKRNVTGVMRAKRKKMYCRRRLSRTKTQKMLQSPGHHRMTDRSMTLDVDRARKRTITLPLGQSVNWPALK